MLEEQVADLSPEGRMALTFVDSWLARSDWSLGQWVSDFTGFSLPPLPQGEPYLWFLEGLGTGRTRRERSGALALRLARILESEPDRQPFDLDRRQALYNVLLLCSDIRQPEVLAEPLEKMLSRAALPAHPTGYNLRFALRQALMMNPKGRELEHLWVDMANGQIHPFLPSDRYAAFDGVLLLPPDDKGEFAVAAMSEVLKALAEALETDELNDRTRDDRFTVMLDTVSTCWAGEQSESLVARFWREAWVTPWPQGALKCVARRLGVRGDSLREIEAYFASIPRSGNGDYRRQRGGIFNAATVFVRRVPDIGARMVQALSMELASWRFEAGVPAG